MIRPSILNRKKHDKILELVYDTDWQDILNDIVACYHPKERDKIIKIMELIND